MAYVVVKMPEAIVELSEEELDRIILDDLVTQSELMDCEYDDCEHDDCEYVLAAFNTLIDYYGN